MKKMLTKEECNLAIECLKISALESTDFNNRKYVLNNYEEIKQLINEHFELVEKATPKKVQYSYFNHQLANYHCFNCGEAQGLKVNKRWRKFCPHCGQALDWSEEDVE